jgi:diguanylate cyclase (GGDEF)-like protein
MNEKIKLLIIGAGNGGAMLVDVFSDEPLIELVGVVDINPEAYAIKEARKKNIPIYLNLDEGLEKTGADIVINVTGKEDLTRTITDKLNDHTICIGGSTAKFIWTLVEENKKVQENIMQLYQIGIELSSFTSSNSLFDFFLSKATDLTDTDAASIAIYNEKQNMLSMVAASGFSDEFMVESITWEPRIKGLTATILNSRDPVIIEDADTHPSFNNPILRKEGVKTLMAKTIRSENRIIGISYVDSFKSKKFLPREISAFKLLSTQVAVAIEKARIIEDFHKKAYEDELTGLSNYRHFLETIKNAFQRSKRYGHPLSLAIMDIDHFKDYNDNFGHLAGNYILSKIGAMIRNNFRELDIRARYGGEEFVVVISEADIEKSYKIAEKFRQHCCEELRPEKDEKINQNVTISIGVASYPHYSKDLQHLIKKADEALYQAKKQGRNRVIR